MELGATFHEKTEVTSLQAIPNTSDDGADDGATSRWRVVTSSGSIIECRHVVVASNGWAPRLVPGLSSHLYPVKNQVILTTPIPPLWPYGWAVGDGADELYGMQRPDGRVLVGGSRSSGPNKEVGNSDDSVLDPGVSDQLRKFLTKFPALQGVEVETEWAGVLGFTKSGKPIVGEIDSGLFVGVGFCGHGMPRCWGVGKALAELVVGEAPSGPLPAQLLLEYAPPEVRPHPMMLETD